MMFKKIVSNVDSCYTYFCEYDVKKGVLMCSNMSSFQHTCIPFDKAPGKYIIGVSLSNVVTTPLKNNILFLQSGTVLSGSRISILKSGTICYRLKPKWRLPIGQDMHVNKKGLPTWRKTPYYFGKTVSTQDEDGFVNIKVDF